LGFIEHPCVPADQLLPGISRKLQQVPVGHSKNAIHHDADADRGHAIDAVQKFNGIFHYAFSIKYFSNKYEILSRSFVASPLVCRWTNRPQR
jgi:hypothetical protein